MRESNRQPLTQQRRGAPVFLWGAISFAAGLAAMGGLWWIQGAGPQHTVSIYWLTDADSDIYYVQQERTVRAHSREEAIADSLLELIDGSNNPEWLSALPEDVRLLGVETEGSDIFLNFSREFASGGGATSMLGRVTQVLYTATSQDNQARVWIAVEGEAIDVLSGEGLILEQPLTRTQFAPTFRPEATLPADPAMASPGNSHS